MPTVEEYRANLIANVAAVFSDVDQGDPIPVALWAMDDAEFAAMSAMEFGDVLTSNSPRRRPRVGNSPRCCWRT